MMIITSTDGDWHELTKTDRDTTPYDTENNPSETRSSKIEIKFKM